MKPKKRTAKRAHKRSDSAKSRKKWTKVDQSAVAELVHASSSPGVVFPLPISALPDNLKQMPGAVSYFVSSYTSPVSLSSALTAGGEMAVIRTDADRAKVYNYVFATSSNGAVCFNGPYKNFPEHHLDIGRAIPIEVLFGHSPFNKK